MTDRQLFRQYLMSFINVPYKWGGSHVLEGLDCSGLVQLALDYLLLDPPGDQTASGLYKHFLSHGDAVKEADLGDLIFFGRPTNVTHVAMAWGPKLMIEAGGGGSDVQTPQDAVRRGAYVKISRIARRPDLVAVIRPFGLEWSEP